MKKKKSKVAEFIDNYAIRGVETEPYERVIPVEHISKLRDAVIEEIIEILQKPKPYGKL